MAFLVRKTQNLILRPLEKSDYACWRLSYETMRPSQNVWDSAHRSSDQLPEKVFNSLLRARKKMRDADSHYSVAVFEKKTGAHVGGLSAMDVIRGVTQSAFLGYWIHNQFWGKGYGKESVRAMFDIAFKDLKLHRLEAGIEPHNRRSIMMVRSIGLRKEGLKKRAVFLRGDWQDLVIYSGTCEDFGVKWKGHTNKRPT